MGDVHVGDIGDRTSHIPCQKSLCITNSKVKCIPEVPTQQRAGSFHVISLLSVCPSHPTILTANRTMPRSASKEVGPCRSPPIRINHDPRPPSTTSPNCPQALNILRSFPRSVLPFHTALVHSRSIPFHSDYIFAGRPMIDPSPQDLNK